MAKESKEDLYFCSNCGSDPFTLEEKCQNFNKTLERFHRDMGHEVIQYQEEKPSIVKQFTRAMIEYMPKNIQELKDALADPISYDVDVNTIKGDINEFNKDTKSGFRAYEEKNSQQHFAKDLVLDIMLPGHFYGGKESCDKWKSKACLESDTHSINNGYLKKVRMHCNNKGCKICASNAIMREARAITNRLITFANQKRNRKIYLKKNRVRILLHTIVSVPYCEHYLFTGKQGRRKLRKKAITILKKFDVDGGVMVDHPYRFSKGLESARLSPHFHLIITGWLEPKKIKEIYEKTGWIISIVSNMDTEQDCYNLCKYLLSHSAVYLKEEGKRSAEHSVRYFGECHNKKFKVESVLKHSLTGNDQIDDIIYPRKEIEIKKQTYKLQKVSYTHSVMDKNFSDTTNKYYEEFVDGNVLKLAKSLRKFIKPMKNLPKDNPAFPQSDVLEMEKQGMEFLQMRFDYGHSHYDIVQSVYINIILDPNLDEICPECSLKMQTLAPPDRGWSDEQAKKIASLIKEMPEGIAVPIDDVEQFDYLRNVGFKLTGIPYFDYDGNLQYDTGIYARPKCIESLNPKLYWSIIRNIDTQEAKYQFKIENGRCPTSEELQEIIRPVKFNKATQSKSILDYV